MKSGRTCAQRQKTGEVLRVKTRRQFAEAISCIMKLKTKFNVSLSALTVSTIFMQVHNLPTSGANSPEQGSQSYPAGYPREVYGSEDNNVWFDDNCLILTSRARVSKNAPVDSRELLITASGRGKSFESAQTDLRRNEDKLEKLLCGAGCTPKRRAQSAESLSIQYDKTKAFASGLEYATIKSPR